MASQHAGDLGEQDAPIVGIFDGKFAFPNDRIEIHKHVPFLLSFSDEHFHRSPIAAWMIVETAAGSL
jgi:hypothetical protein